MDYFGATTEFAIEACAMRDLQPRDFAATTSITRENFDELLLFMQDPRTKVGINRFYSEADVTCLTFHGDDYKGEWVWEGDSQKTVAEIAASSGVDMILACNPTQQDIEQSDRIYVVGNNLIPFNLALPSGFSRNVVVGVYPEFPGQGYFSIRGERIVIPVANSQP